MISKKDLENMKNNIYEIKELKVNGYYTKILRLNSKSLKYKKGGKLLVHTKEELENYINSKKYNEVLEYLKEIQKK